MQVLRAVCHSVDDLDAKSEYNRTQKAAHINYLKKKITGGILNKEDKQMHNKAMIIQIKCLKNLYQLSTWAKVKSAATTKKG